MGLYVIPLIKNYEYLAIIMLIAPFLQVPSFGQKKRLMYLKFNFFHSV